MYIADEGTAYNNFSATYPTEVRSVVCICCGTDEDVMQRDGYDDMCEVCEEHGKAWERRADFQEELRAVKADGGMMSVKKWNHIVALEWVIGVEQGNLERLGAVIAKRGQRG